MERMYESTLNALLDKRIGSRILKHNSAFYWTYATQVISTQYTVHKLSWIQVLKYMYIELKYTKLNWTKLLN